MTSRRFVRYRKSLAPLIRVRCPLTNMVFHRRVLRSQDELGAHQPSCVPNRLTGCQPDKRVPTVRAKCPPCELNAHQTNGTRTALGTRNELGTKIQLTQPKPSTQLNSTDSIYMTEMGGSS